MARPKQLKVDILQRKVIDLSTLRTMIVALQNEKYEEISIYDLLIYIKPVTRNKENA